MNSKISKSDLILTRTSVAVLCIGLYWSFSYVMPVLKRAEWLLYSVATPIKLLAVVGLLNLFVIPAGLYFSNRASLLQLGANVITLLSTLYFLAGLVMFGRS